MPTWKEILERNPGHSEAYAARWKNFVDEGKDIHGEARFLDALAPRNAQILDAGCGTGRVGGELAARGHIVTGVDVDPTLIEHARTDFPDSTWMVADLAADSLPEGPFDIVFTAGNVLTFLAPADRPKAVLTLSRVLADDGRMVMGFGLDRGYHYRQFLEDVAQAGLEEDLLLSTWDIRPFNRKSGFLVAVLRKPS